jgi:hypothetical protein
MKLKNTAELDRLTGYTNAMSHCLDGCNYVTWFSAKIIEFDGEINFTDLEICGLAGSSLDSQLQAIVQLAYPESKPFFATVTNVSCELMMSKLNQFVAHDNLNALDINLVSYRKQSLMDGFWQHVDTCINIEGATILEYVPEFGKDDILCDFIIAGFTFLVFNQAKSSCLILHCGAAD